MARHRVLILGDQQAFVDVLASRLGREADLNVVARASCGAFATSAMSAEPDVVIIDCDECDEDGIEVANQLQRRRPDLAIVLLAARRDAAAAYRAMRSGIVGFVPKDATVSELVVAIRGALRGETWYPSGALTGGVERFQLRGVEPTAEQRRVDRLTPREREVLECMVAGLDRAATAQALFLSPNTVRTHSRQILRKLEVHSSIGAVALALRAGVVPPSSRVDPAD